MIGRTRKALRFATDRSATGQLRRILDLVPRIADGERHAIADLALGMGVPEKALRRDIRDLANRFDDPGGFVERLQIIEEAEHVEVCTPHFHRPMRLTVAELRALELGLAMLSAERPPDERAAIERAQARLRRVLAKLPAQDPADALGADDVLATGQGDALDDAQREHLATLRRARLARRKVRLGYRKAESSTPVERIVQPYALVMGRGTWYAIALCESSAELRVFRLDRIADVALAAERFEVPPDFDPHAVLRGGAVFVAPADGEETLVVRYGPAIARWIAEREGRDVDADGSVTIAHPLADTAWAVRHVLQYGADAEVVSPPHVRAAVVARLDAMRGGAGAAVTGAGAGSS